MALLALVMSIGFVACSSSSDDGNSNSGGNATKKLVRITETGDKREEVKIFTYDTNGKVNSYYDGKNTCSLKWSDSSVTATWDSGETYTSYLMNNLIGNSTNNKTSYTYNNDNKLTKMNCVFGLSTRTETYKWDGDKLMEAEDYFTFSYSGKTCKGFNPIIIDLGDSFDSDPWCFACPELIGLKSNQLPDSYKWDNREAKVTYKFDSEGYVTEFTVLIYLDGNTETPRWTMNYKLTWE